MLPNTFQEPFPYCANASRSLPRTLLHLDTKITPISYRSPLLPKFPAYPYTQRPSSRPRTPSTLPFPSEPSQNSPKFSQNLIGPFQNLSLNFPI